MKYKTILITGGAGFIGSNLAVFFKKKYPKFKVISLDNLKRRGAELNIKRLKENNVKFVHGDIRNPEDLEIKTKIDLLIECSAEPSVLSGFRGDPKYLINTNLLGAVNCFELARRNKADVIFLSSSRIYPYDRINNIEIIENRTRFEWKNDGKIIPGWSKQGIDVVFPLDGLRSMYGATKLAAEFILNEYVNMYGVRATINRCGVVAGPWQFGKTDQGVFSLWVLAHYFKKPLQYIGYGAKGKQVRDILHIEDLFELIDLQINSMDKVNGRTFNVGGGKDISLSLLEATHICQNITKNKIHINTVEKNRPADLAIYITDNKKVTEALCWKPKRDVEKILRDIYIWVKSHKTFLMNLLT